MRLVASRAALPKCGLVVHRLLCQFRLVGMARETNIHRIGLWKSGGFAGVRAVAVGAISHGTGVRHLGVLNLFGLFFVTRYADFLGTGLGQNDFSVLGRLVTEFTLLFTKGHVDELLHQFGAVGLVRIVAGQAIRLLEWLVLMRLDKAAVFDVMAVQAE